MSITDLQLDAFISDRSLVSIRREKIDSRSLQAIPIHYSDTLLLVQYVYDFHLDGKLILRRSDITSMECRATDQFQKELLSDHGLIEQIDFEFEPDLSSFVNLLKSQPEDAIVILEREDLEEPDFWIGRLIDLSDDAIQIYEFSGAANWHHELTAIPPNEVTCCQLNTNYIRCYAKYFKSQPRPPMPT